jgi:hypothetical protein
MFWDFVFGACQNVCETVYDVNEFHDNDSRM